MATPPYITVTFDPPTASDTDAQFDTKAFDTVGKWNPWSTEANGLADYVNTRADQALAAATGGDLPTLTGYGDQFLKVKTDESAAEFSNYTSPENIDDLGDITFAQGDILYHDGTNLVNLGKGTAGQTLSMNSGATAPEWSEPPLGVGQTWQDVSGSRVAGTTYQNTTGQSIEVSGQFAGSAGRTFQMSSDGVTWVSLAQSGGASVLPFGGVVPNGYYYRVDGLAMTWVYWAELR